MGAKDTALTGAHDKVVAPQMEISQYSLDVSIVAYLGLSINGRCIYIVFFIIMKLNDISHDTGLHAH